jgi:hypothetical protein
LRCGGLQPTILHCRWFQKTISAGGHVIVSNANSSWSKSALLHNILKSEPTTPEMGLSKHGTMSFDSATELQVVFAELATVRDTNDRFARIQFMSRTELMSVVNSLVWQEGKANIFVFALQAELKSAESEHTLYLWNETGVE